MYACVPKPITIVTTIKRNQEDMRTSAIVLTHPSYQCHERGG